MWYTFPMKILAIETSCDETAIAILHASGPLEDPTFEVLGDQLLSQAMKHREYGGVYPSLAKREHAKNLTPILKETLREAEMLTESDGPGPLNHDLQAQLQELLRREPGLYESLSELLSSVSKPDIDLIAVTRGPGLEPALWVGVNFAKALSAVWNIDIVPINHMEGHMVSVLSPGEVKSVRFPAIALLVSGGHTELVLVKNWGEYELIGRTRDDAVGEAFDKVARMLGLPYPGGPEIERLAKKGTERNMTLGESLPRPMINSGDYDFSYSGLKTAVLRIVQGQTSIDENFKQSVAREFVDAAFDILIAKTEKALDYYGARTLIVGGGVIASPELRARLAKIQGIDLHVPNMNLTTDNAVMIGIAAYMRGVQKAKPTEDALTADGNLRLAE